MDDIQLTRTHLNSPKATNRQLALDQHTDQTTRTLQ